MRTIPALIVAVILGLFISAQAAKPGAKGPGQAQTAAPQSVSLVISATDSSGNPLSGLSRSQVSVYEGKEATQTLGVQSASNLPLHLGFVLLASKTKFNQEQAATIALAQKMMRPGVDEAFVVTAGGEKSWTNSKIAWLADAPSVTETVHGLDKNTGLPDLFNYVLSTDQAGLGRLSIQTYNLGTGFSVFDVVWLMMKNDPRPARRVVVIFRLATAHSPGLGEKVTAYSEATHNRVISIAQSLDVSFFTIGLDDDLLVADPGRANVENTYMPSHMGGDDADARKYDQDMARRLQLQYSAGRDNVNRIADETGGRSYWTTKKNFPDAVAAISTEVAAQYVISVVPPAGASGTPVPIRVQVAGATHVSAPRACVPPGQ